MGSTTSLISMLTGFKVLFTLSFLVLQYFPSYNAQPHAYIVHMDTSAMPKVFTDHHSWHFATLSSISDTNPTTQKLIYSYTDALHGFSATLTLAELGNLKKSPGYVSSTRDHPLKLQTTHTPQFLGLNSISGAWPASEYGKDVIIGVVDSGIWPESESFSDEGIGPIPLRWKGSCSSGSRFNFSLCNRKVIGARIFNKGVLANHPKLNLSMNSPRDMDGHGTHTSSTAAGNFVKGASYFGYAPGTARGVAPKARIAIYKAAWMDLTYSSDVIAAIDQAIRDGIDILSLSIGSPPDSSFIGDDPIAMATFAAAEKGIFVAAAAGNDGPVPWTIMNGAPWISTVGASTVDREFHGVLTLGNGVQITFLSVYPGNFSRRKLPITFMGTCNDAEKLARIKSKIIVCKDMLDITIQVEACAAARVSGAVFITNSSSEFYIDGTFPAAAIGSQDGEILLEYISKSSNPRGTFGFRKTVTGRKPAPGVTTLSSRGPYKVCPTVLKPDMIAPGSLVLASWPPRSPVTVISSGPLFSSFNLVSGTSMACPHVAGTAALIKSVHRDWSPAAVRSALVTTADSLDNSGNPIKDLANYNFPATPLDIGAGHINPNKALSPGLIYDANAEDYIKYLCTLHYTRRQMRLITKSSYNCTKQPFDLNYPSFIVFIGKDDAHPEGKFVQEFRRTVTNVGDEKSSYTAKVIGMEGYKAMVEPEKLGFRQKNEKLSYKLILQGQRREEQVVVHGSLNWVNDNGKYIVRSPIVATSISQESSLRT